MKNYKTIMLGEIMRQARKEKKMTLSSLAEKLNVTDATICRYEKGDRDMTIDTFFKMCDILELSPNEIQKALRK